MVPFRSDLRSYVCFFLSYMLRLLWAIGSVCYIWGYPSYYTCMFTLIYAPLLPSIQYLYTVNRFVWVSAKFGTCTVVSVNCTPVEDKMRWFEGECAHFSCSKCPIYTLDGARAKFSTNSLETVYSVGSIFYESMRAMISLLWAMLLSFQAMLPVHLSRICSVVSELEAPFSMSPCELWFVYSELCFFPSKLCFPYTYLQYVYVRSLWLCFRWAISCAFSY